MRLPATRDGANEVEMLSLGALLILVKSPQTAVILKKQELTLNTKSQCLEMTDQEIGVEKRRM